MLKKLFVLFSFTVFTLSACGTLEVSIALTPDPTATQTQPPAEATPVPIYTPAQPEADISPPQFSGEIRFTTDPNVFSPQYFFPARVRQIFAVWDYSGMLPGIIVRREWYRNGELWLEREEPWDFVKYGASGTAKDVSIYDFEIGLEAGDYELVLYIDGNRQQRPIESNPYQNKFSILEGEVQEIVSLDGRWTATLDDPQKLVLVDSGGMRRELTAAREMASLAWFPDNRHIVYSNVVRPERYFPSNVGNKSQLWIADVLTGSQHQLDPSDENLYRPLVSPDGRYIVAMRNLGHDACMVGGLVFIELDDNLRMVRKFTHQDFAGMPAETTDGGMYPGNVGTWQDDTHFEIGLNWTCRINPPSGMYTFDLTGMQVARTGDLPIP
jgi:hypothetical protein